MSFDPDALLAAMPKREIRPIPEGVRIPKTRSRAVPTESAMGEPEEYNGFSKRERYRIADLSVWLAKVGATDRPTICDICGGEARDEHAENYYDLSAWVGLCIPCHRNALHKRFDKPSKWLELLDNYQLPNMHWTRLLSLKPFDMAAHIRKKSVYEPTRQNFI